MEHPERCVLSFSGGKDSILALDRAIRQGLQVDYLVTMYDEASQRVRFHGVPIALIQAQANALGIPLLAYPNAPDAFETIFLQSLHDLRQRRVHYLTKILPWAVEVIPPTRSFSPSTNQESEQGFWNRR